MQTNIKLQKFIFGGITIVSSNYIKIVNKKNKIDLLVISYKTPSSISSDFCNGCNNLLLYMPFRRRFREFWIKFFL